MTAPNLDQRAFDAAYAELRDWVSDVPVRVELARDIVAALREDYGPAQVERIANDREREVRADFASWFLLDWNPVYADLQGLQPSEIDAAVAAAARVLAEGE